MKRRAQKKGDKLEANFIEAMYILHQALARGERTGYQIRISRAIHRKRTLGMAWDGFCKRKSAGMTEKGKPISEMKGVPGLAKAEVLTYNTVGFPAYHTPKLGP
jgi:hypothetical protein